MSFDATFNHTHKKSHTIGHSILNTSLCINNKFVMPRYIILVLKIDKCGTCDISYLNSIIILR